MQDEWLLGVLLEVQTYAIEQNCPGLLPLIGDAFAIARAEMDLNGSGHLAAAHVASASKPGSRQQVSSVLDDGQTKTGRALFLSLPD